MLNIMCTRAKVNPCKESLSRRAPKIRAPFLGRSLYSGLACFWSTLYVSFEGDVCPFMAPVDSVDMAEEEVVIVGRTVKACGWLSNLWSLFGYLKY